MEAINMAKMREALEPKTDTEWEAICARCREGESPKECQYYGDPDGCSADGHYPMTQIGNCAKMRRVCEQMLELLKAPPGFNDGGMSVELDEEQVVMWRERFLAALAAPPRNCDVGSAVEQNKRFVEYCKGHRIKIIGHVDVCDTECPCRKGGDLNLCALRWSQMPYEDSEKGEMEMLPPCTCGGEPATVERGTEPEGFAIMCSRCFRRTALHPSLALAEEEWRTMLTTNNTTTKEMKGGAE